VQGLQVAWLVGALFASRPHPLAPSPAELERGNADGAVLPIRYGLR
jgi:hypothetical protein